MDSMNEMVETGELLQPLVERGVTKVPRRFLRPLHQRPGAVCTKYAESIPVIDMRNLQGSQRQRTVAEMVAACEDWGFFQVVNHGIPEAVLHSVQKAAMDFFNSPLEDKQLCANGKRMEGYGRVFKVSETALWDWVDVLNHRVGPTPLSDTDLAAWPPKPSSYRPAMEEYSKEARILAQKLFAILSENLGLPATFLEEALGTISQVVRLNYYPPCPQPDLVLGLSSHSDPGALTVLLQATQVGGLQVSKDGRWVPVHPLPGALIINLGDQMQVLTNGRYKSVEHRVIANRGQERVSIATFCSPLLDSIVSPLPQLVKKADSPRYQEYKFRDYVASYMKHELGGPRLLESMKIQNRNPQEIHEVQGVKSKFFGSQVSKTL